MLELVTGNLVILLNVTTGRISGATVNEGNGTWKWNVETEIGNGKRKAEMVFTNQALERAYCIPRMRMI